ncbi:MAG: hypothetical protein V2I34_12695 [Bacteroidales bacterium]|jgi:hypothetical protein|nr:hypothetical protein [Bacteroidales bacterium]
MISSSSLANYRFKFLGLVLSSLGIILFVILKILDYSYVEGWQDRIFMINHFVIVLGMVMIMYSSESNDDERVKLIRDSLLKFFFALLVCGIMLYMIMTSLESLEGSFYHILYIIEIVLAGYLITFHISLRTNPSWIFRKPKAIRGRFIVMGISIMFLIAWIVYVVITYKY